MNNFWKEKRVLVTGATGLVGSWLVKSLVEKEASVVALIRDHDPQSEFFRSQIAQKTALIQGSLEDFSSVERAINEHEVDTIFHLGAQTIVGTALRSPLSTFDSNIKGTYNLLEACRRHSSLVKRIVVASSDKAYGSSDILPYIETMPLEGRHPYDVSKSCADLITLSYFHTYNLPVTIARCGNIFGGGDLNWSRLIPGVIRSLNFGAPPEIRSDGTYTRDYVYVEDVVSAYLLLAENLYRTEVRGEAFNFGPNFPYSVLEVVKIIQKQMQKSELNPLILSHVKAEIRNQSLSSEKAQKILHWEPLYDLQEGLVETIKWYQNYFTQPSFCASHG